MPIKIKPKKIDKIPALFIVTEVEKEKEIMCPPTSVIEPVAPPCSYADDKCEYEPASISVSGLLNLSFLDSEIMDLDELEAYQERAAIIEFDGNVKREHAEKLALECIVNERVYSGLQKSLIDQFKAIEIKGSVLF